MVSHGHAGRGLWVGSPRWLEEIQRAGGPARDPTPGANRAGAEAHPRPLVTRKGLTRSPWVGRGADGAAATVLLQGRRASLGVGVR